MKLSAAFFLLAALPALAADEAPSREAQARAFLDGVNNRDVELLTKVTHELVYVVLSTDEHIEVARGQAALPAGIRKHFRKTTLHSPTSVTDGHGDFILMCTKVRVGKKLHEWMISFEFRGEKIRNVIFLTQESLCKPE